jgi:hypothetical protein
MSHDFLQKRNRVSTAITPTGVNGPVVLTGTGDKFIFTPSNPSTIIRWGIVYAVAKDASAMSMTLAKRVTVGSDTGRVVQDTLSDAAARAQGIVTERVLLGANPNSSTGADGSLVNVARGGPCGYQSRSGSGYCRHCRGFCHWSGLSLC